MKPTLSFVAAIKACFSKYATFSGRARRSEFWWFYLLSCIPSWVLSFAAKWKMGVAAELQNQLTLSNADEMLAKAESVDSTFMIVSIICGIAMLALLIPTLAVWTRRLHDTGKSGLHILWCLLCGIGALIPIIMCIQDSKPGANQYGENPKE